MTSTQHLIVSPLLLAFAPVIGIEHAIVAACASVVIDIDHVYIPLVERAFSVRKLRAIISNIHKKEIAGKPNRAYVDILYLFHTVEFNAALLLWAGYAHSALAAVLAMGFVYHVICDAIHHARHELPVASWLFMSNWLRAVHSGHAYAKLSES